MKVNSEILLKALSSINYKRKLSKLFYDRKKAKNLKGDMSVNVEGVKVHATFKIGNDEYEFVCGRHLTGEKIIDGQLFINNNNTGIKYESIDVDIQVGGSPPLYITLKFRVDFEDDNGKHHVSAGTRIYLPKLAGLAWM